MSSRITQKLKYIIFYSSYKMSSFYYLGAWSSYRVLSNIRPETIQFSHPHKYIVMLKKALPINPTQIIDTVQEVMSPDIEYYQPYSKYPNIEFLRTIGTWNEITVVSHYDDTPDYTRIYEVEVKECYLKKNPYM